MVYAETPATTDQLKTNIRRHFGGYAPKRATKINRQEGNIGSGHMA